jgi:hypothetical protein
MSLLVVADPLIRPVQCSAWRDHANVALGRILDAEIEALKARLGQRCANTALDWGLARSGRSDMDRQLGWLRDSVTKLQSRRDMLG